MVLNHYGTSHQKIQEQYAQFHIPENFIVQGPQIKQPCPVLV